MARRIGLAQAMINDPALLILDEPTSGLDPLGCREVKDLIKMLKKRGKTVIVTSHLLSDIEDVCDRVIILYGGKIRAMGTLNELLEVSNENRIITPELKPEVMNHILSILRENLHGEEFVVDHPRRSLEEFFLDVINKAKADSVETAGVVSGGRIADYLADPDNKDALLDKLIQPDLPTVAAEKQRAEEEAARKAAEDKQRKLDNALDQLTRDEKAAPTQSNAEKIAENVAEADEKLSSLLGNDKK